MSPTLQDRMKLMVTSKFLEHMGAHDDGVICMPELSLPLLYCHQRDEQYECSN